MFALKERTQEYVATRAWNSSTKTVNSAEACMEALSNDELEILSKQLRRLSDRALLESTERAVDSEKSAVKVTTRHLLEVDRRRAYLPEFATMFDYLTKKYGFCNGSAQLRIGTLKLIAQVPVAQEKIERCEMSMTVAANIVAFLNSEKKMARPYSTNAKIELVEACTGKSTLEVQREFVRRNPELEKRELVRPTSASRVRIEVSLTNEALAKLNELRDHLAHVDPTMSLGQLIERLADDGLEKYSPKRKAARAIARREKNRMTSVNPPASGADEAKADSRPERNLVDDVAVSNQKTNCESKLGKIAHPDESVHVDEVKRSRYVPASQKHNVSEDGLGCTHVDSRTGRRCGSRKFLQLDHVDPFAMGGAHAAENLRWLCGAHNRWRSGHAN